MIVIQLQGGLGNQMFQYAFGKALAELHQVPLELDLSFLNRKANGYTQRHFSLDIFPLSSHIATTETIDAFEKARATDLFHRIKRQFIQPIEITHFEKGFPFQPVPYNAKQNNRYIGFWQSEKYFNSIREIILKEFAFPIDTHEQANAMRERIDGCEAISLHIRRGDYISNHNANQFHGICSDDYYYTAVKEITQGLKHPELFIFSDEPNWVKEHMSFDLPSHYIDFNTNDRSHYDMELMSRCSHHIIANSSFSWWGAWLNDKAGKRVIAPRQWFSDTSVDTKDLIPAAWQKM